MVEPMQQKIFISWAGDYAGKVADALHDWLGTVLDSTAKLWMSRVGINPGARGLDVIKEELDETSFGIIVVTREGMNRPWLNFEAGALSKSVPGHEKPPIVPVLVDLEGAAQIDGPLGQFQCVQLDQDGILELVETIASVTGMNVSAIQRRFESMWSQLDRALSSIDSSGAGAGESRRDQYDMIAETLEIVRWQSGRMGLNQEQYRRDLLDKIKRYCADVDVPVYQLGFVERRPGERERIAVYTSYERATDHQRAQAVAMVAESQLDVEVSLVHNKEVEAAFIAHETGRKRKVDLAKSAARDAREDQNN